MRCHEVSKHLDAFRTGELAGTLHDTVSRHLAACRSCAAALQALSRLAEEAPHLRVPAPEDVLERVRQAVEDQYGVVETDFGPAWVGFTPHGISMIQLDVADDRAFVAEYEKRFSRRIRRGSVPQKYARAVQRSLQGEPSLEVPVALDGLSAFERTVLHHLRRIPRGEVRPYAWLAREAGRPRAARAVGTIMARNPVPFLLPCHRVVPTTGGVGNYGYGPDMKRTLLEREGVSVEDLDACERRGVRYIGSLTTGIFCYPTCRDARRIHRENRVPFASAAEAEAQGYRPCRHCRPLTAEAQAGTR
jgi:O-6-methylguanine DNA methyltransferase